MTTDTTTACAVPPPQLEDDEAIRAAGLRCTITKVLPSGEIWGAASGVDKLVVVRCR